MNATVAMLTGVVVYFLVACAAIMLGLLPTARARARLWMHRRLAAGTFNVRRARIAGARGFGATTAAAGTLGRAAAGGLAPRMRWIVAGTVALAVPPLLAWALHGRVDLGTFDHTASRAVNAQIAALLQGEQLVPPTALPPELFMTPEVEAARPLVRHASREWRRLDDDFRQRLLIVFRLMQERHGYELVLLEGYRSPERQAQLAALGSHVTRAGAYQSYHQFGLAADVAFRRDGKVLIRETDPWAMRGYELYGDLAGSVGLTWGGAWTLRDYGHVELRRSGVMRAGRGGEPPTAQAQ